MRSLMPSVLPALAQLNNMENKTFTLTLTIDQINLLMSGLAELPFKASNALIQEIVRQFGEQQDKVEVPVPVQD